MLQVYKRKPSVMPMTSAFKSLLPVAALALVAAAPLPAAAQNMTTKTAAASDAFPGLRGFLSLAPADRSEIAVYYTIRIKHGDASKASITLNDNGRSTPIHIGAGGRLSPMPTLAQLDGGAQVTVVYPTDATTAMKIHVYSTQTAGTTYDATRLARGVKQGNNAMGKIAGVLAFGIPKLDRIYFVGGGNATADVNGRSTPLPKTAGDGEYPAGTPYFVPAQMSGATTIHLSSTPSIAMYDNAPK